MIAELTLPMALELAAHLDPRDCADALQAYPDLDRWALERCTLPGAAWALIVRGDVLAAGGVVSKDAETGVLWLAGREGWTRYIKHAVRIWREIRACGLYRRFECRCAIGRDTATRFAERMGFQRLYARDGFVHYEVAL